MNLDTLFSTWPFSVVPSRGSDLVWAGRPSLRDQVSTLLTSFSYRPQSTFDLVWASFGSGKTHLLYYLEQRAHSADRLIPWYTVLPNGASSFADVYKTLMSSFPIAILASAPTSTPSASGANEIGPVLRALSIGTDDQKRIATDWLVGRRVDMRSAPRLVPIPYKLDNTTHMQRVFRCLLSFLATTQGRLLLLFDEFQRIRTYKPAVREVLQATILDCFNAIPRGLSIVFSCSAIQQAAALSAFPPDLTDRLRGRRLLTLDEMTLSEASEFVADLLGAFRPPGFDGEPFDPFSQKGLQPMFREICDSSDLRLIPRHIIQVLDCALNDAVANGLGGVAPSALLDAARSVRQLTTTDRSQ